MNKSILVLALLGSSLSAPAFASDGEEGFYGSLRVGAQTTSKIGGVIYAPAGTFSPDEGGGEGGEQTAAAVSVPAGSDTLGGRFKTKAGLSIGGELGYDFGMVRAGVEVGYGTNKIKSLTVSSFNGGPFGEVGQEDADLVCDFLFGGGSDADCTATGNGISVSGASFAKVRQWAVMASAWVDIPTGSPLEPYVGGGVGFTDYRVKTAAGSDNKTRFAWQVGAGVAYKLNPSTAITLDYRYRQAKGARLFDTSDTGLAIGKLKTHSFGAGVRFTF